MLHVTTGTGGGLLFRASTTAPLFYLFRVDTSGVYLVSAYQGASASDATDLTHGFTNALSKRAGATNILTVIASGQQFDLYLNQVFVTQVRDRTLASGVVGAVASNEGATAQVVYTNARVWNLGA